MKRLIGILLCLTFVFSFVGCSGNGGDSDSNKSSRNKNTVLGFLTQSRSQPLIIYEADIDKDADVFYAYVIEKGQCRLYHCKTTLGELSRMTDKEILQMLEAEYNTGLAEARRKWESNSETNRAINSGKVKLYKPRSYDITGCLFTDSTGNSVVSELLFFPKSGVSGTPYIIEYPQYTSADDKFMNYYGTYEDPSTYRDIKFKVAYFNTGFGTRSDLNQINNIYYITEDAMTSGTVYDSNYYGIQSESENWSNKNRTLCFRVDNPKNFNLRLDKLSSSDIAYVDPSENDLLQISNTYYSTYYNSFGPYK